MLDFLRGKASARKLHLFACACMRRVEAIYRCYNLELNPIVEAEEERADSTLVRQGVRSGRVPVKELKGGFYDAQRIAAQKLLNSFSRGPGATILVSEIVELLKAHTNFCYASFPSASPLVSYLPETTIQADLLRELFGDLFHAAQPQQARVASTNDAERVARAIYAGRIFADLPILADAIEDAGCADAGILGHLRGPGPHVRGCWALDLILGKE
jgi:hypothetical protein